MCKINSGPFTGVMKSLCDQFLAPICASGTLGQAGPHLGRCRGQVDVMGPAYFGILVKLITICRSSRLPGLSKDHQQMPERSAEAAGVVQ